MPNQALPYIFDVPAMRAWADASSNEASTILAEVKSGTVVIFNRVWDSFKNAYADKAAKLPKSEFECARADEEHRLAAAAIVDKLNAHFPMMGPYDDSIEWTVAGIAIAGPYTIVTDEKRKQRYAKIDGLSVVTYDEFFDGL
jgi:hypothetical protein